MVHIPIQIATPPPARGWAGSGRQKALDIGSLVSKISAVVMRFVVRVGTGIAMKFLERNVRKGLRVMRGNDPRGWRRIDDITQLKLPTARKLRIMLWLHGTFSDTLGSFGALTSTAEGRALLAAANREYDVVLGFDHPTLSETPSENALDLVERFARFTTPMCIDCVSYSRGGLVLRSLLEQLLPAGAAIKRPRLHQVVFVGVPNDGTLLAEPANWKAWVDVHTNLAVGACSLLRVLPGGGAIADVLQGLLSGLAALVKLLADVVITDGAVPGLSAMQPKGAFVRALNASGPGQPLPASSRYLAVTSNFDARAALASPQPTGLGQPFLLRLADGLVDGLLGEPNDLVVNSAAMTVIDPQAGDFIDARLDFEASSLVYHTVYFAQPQVAQQLRAWLLGQPTA